MILAIFARWIPVAFAVLVFSDTKSRVINLLLTEFARAVLGEYRPSVFLVRTSPKRLGPYCQDLGPIFSQHGPRTRSIRYMYHARWHSLLSSTTSSLLAEKRSKQANPPSPLPCGNLNTSFLKFHHTSQNGNLWSVVGWCSARPGRCQQCERLLIQSTPWWLVLLFSSHTGWISSDEAFLFSLKNQEGRAFKMEVQEGRQRKAMESWNDRGPRFGGGHDLHIGKDCHTDTISHSNPGYTYQLPLGYKYDTPQAQSLLAGSETFNCDEYEVFYQQ